MSRSTKILTLLLAMFFLFGSTWAVGGKLSPELQEAIDKAAPDDELEVIVYMKEQVERAFLKQLDKQKRSPELLAALRDKAKKDQEFLQKMAEQRENIKIRSLWMINGASVSATPAAIIDISRYPQVKEIRLDMIIPLAAQGVSATTADQWNLGMVGVDTLWADTFQGQGVVVATMDTGVDYLHNALAGSWRGGENSWFDPHGEHNVPYDAHGHGTQVTGIIAGQIFDSHSIGMAPQAKWIGVKIFNDNDIGHESDIHLGFQWLLDPDGNPATNDAPDIVNNSWGLPDTRDTCYTGFLDDIQILNDLGIAVVFSAGNQGPGSSSISPANNPGVFSVGSVDELGIIDQSSSQGPSACPTVSVYPTATAPGVQVLTADLTFNGVFENATVLASGTSFAAPHVSGAMALLLSFDPALTPIDLEAALAMTAGDLGDPGDDNIYGSGLINVAAAYNLLNVAEPAPGECVDNDGDGFSSGDTCGPDIVRDCDDTDSTIHPDGIEVAYDTIDQNCDGVDLTIMITKAEFKTRKDSISVRATSALDADAQLSAHIDGLESMPMSWNRKRGYWELAVSKVTNKGFLSDGTAVVTVYGPEGEIGTPLITSK